MKGFFPKLILPLVVVIVAVCGLLARNNAEQWGRLYDEAQRLYDDERYEETFEAAARSLERAEGWLGLTATCKSDSLNLIGLSLKAMGRYEEADAAYRRALQIEERAWGREGNPDYAAVLDNLAISCNAQERYEEAATFAEEALGIWEEIGSLRRIRSLKTLASAYCGLEDYEQAAVYAQMTVQMLEVEWPEDEAGLVNALHWQGDIYYILERYEEAEVVLRRAFELALRVALPEVVDLLDCASDALLVQDKIVEIEALYVWAIEFLQYLPREGAAVMAEDGSIDWEHPDVLLSGVLTNLGNLYMEIDAYTKAATQFRRVSELDARLYGAEAPSVVTDLNDLGVALDLASSYALAEEAYLQALAILAQWEEPDNDRVLVVLQNLAETYENSGQLQKLTQTRARMHALMPEEVVQPLASAREADAKYDNAQEQAPAAVAASAGASVSAEPVAP